MSNFWNILKPSYWNQNRMSIGTFIKEIKKFPVSVEIKPGDKRINITGTQTRALDVNALIDLIDLVDELKGWEVFMAIEYPTDTAAPPKDNLEGFNGSGFVTEERSSSPYCGKPEHIVPSKIEDLKEKLDEAIKNEDFLEAARLRDLIKENDNRLE